MTCMGSSLSMGFFDVVVEPRHVLPLLHDNAAQGSAKDVDGDNWHTQPWCLLQGVLAFRKRFPAPLLHNNPLGKEATKPPTQNNIDNFNMVQHWMKGLFSDPVNA